MEPLKNTPMTAISPLRLQMTQTSSPYRNLIRHCRPSLRIRCLDDIQTFAFGPAFAGLSLEGLKIS